MKIANAEKLVAPLIEECIKTVEEVKLANKIVANAFIIQCILRYC